MKITQVFAIDTAHRLLNHKGKCKNLHGHRYQIELTLFAHELNDDGMVLDFGDIKSTCGTYLDEMLDHGTVLQAGDPIAHALVKIEPRLKLLIVDHPPTAEFLANYLYNVFAKLLGDNPLSVCNVRVRETPSCWADYDGDS